MSEDYFLSGANPTATTDQRDLEARAIALLKRPELQRARAILDMLWRHGCADSARAQMDRFDNAVNELTFWHTLHGVNADGANPKVLRIMAPPGHWFGRDTPGSRWGGDSPDFIYRFIPITHGARYEIRATPTCADPPSVTYTLTSDAPAPYTIGLLDSLDIELGASGEIVITLDDAPAGARRNHIQTKPGESHLLVRDALGDWQTQTPYRLRATRLDAGSSAPWTDEQCAHYAAQSLLAGFYYAYYCTQSASGQAPNQVRTPVSAAPFGGMPTQFGSKGNICIEADEALIVTTNDAGAKFRNATLCNQFFMTANYWSRAGSLNHAQMRPDGDGRFTYVIAHQDPGVANWLDTGGLKRMIFGHRWQAFGPQGAREAPSIETRLVKFNALDKALPSGVQSITTAERAAQLAARQAGFQSRFIDR